MDNQERQSKLNVRAEAYDWIQSVLVALVVCVLLFVFGVRMVNVDGESMLPTLENGDRVIISNLFYTPKQGDIVVLRKEAFLYEPIVKRVIAVEGQTIDIDFNKGVVYVDDVALDEPYTLEPTYKQLDFSGPVTVPEGCVFVMGDNRNGSTDSRYSVVGCVDTRLIQGRVYLTVFPLKNFGWEAKHEGSFA